MSFETRFPNLYKGPYEEEIVASWQDIYEIEKVQHPHKADPFSREVPDPSGKLKPTHFTVKVPPNTQVVYYPSGDDHSIFSPFRPGEIVLYLGEVAGMKGHGVFVDHDGKVRYGYHNWNFKVIPESYI